MLAVLKLNDIFLYSEGVEVFGSWNDIAPRLKSDVNLEQEIFDAINDTVIDHSSLTVISGNTSLTGHM
jgi:hypothetical protein